MPHVSCDGIKQAITRALCLALVKAPFTVESLSPHGTRIVNDDDTISNPLRQGAAAEGATDFAQMILNTLSLATT